MTLEDCFSSMQYDEDDLLPLSALQHLAFCERQCALIHIEGLWVDNRLTVLGSQLHARSHSGRSEVREGVISRRAMPVRSLRLGIAGKADVVEFYPLKAGEEEGGVKLSGLPGAWRPYPVEYKRGSPKPARCDEVQVCAQALCLEEMLGLHIPEAAIYYGQPRRRHVVRLTLELRAETERIAARLRELIVSGSIPRGTYQRRCRSCSLVEWCLPKTRRRLLSANRYFAAMMRNHMSDRTGGGYT